MSFGEPIPTGYAGWWYRRTGTGNWRCCRKAGNRVVRGECVPIWEYSGMWRTRESLERGLIVHAALNGWVPAPETPKGE